MKPVVIVMAVIDVEGQQVVSCSVGLGDGKRFIYLGSLRCRFEEFGIVNSYLNKVPSLFLDYRKDKWDNYLADILKQLSECL